MMRDGKVRDLLRRKSVMSRVFAAALFVALWSLASGPSPADASQVTSRFQAAGGASRAIDMPVQTVAYRYRSYRSSTGRRPGTGFTPWYLLPKTDPRRYNGPHYYWNK
jgi:hypothetical protein